MGNFPDAFKDFSALEGAVGRTIALTHEVKPLSFVDKIESPATIEGYHLEDDELLVIDLDCTTPEGSLIDQITFRAGESAGTITEMIGKTVNKGGDVAADSTIDKWTLIEALKKAA